MNKQETLYRIGITLIPTVGDATAKKLIAYCGGVEAVFKEKSGALQKIPSIGKKVADAIVGQNVLGRAEEEIKQMEKRGIEPLFYLDSKYPKRLFHCDDGPVMLYTKGEMNLNQEKVLSVVGCRKATEHGKSFTEKLVADLAARNVTIVSGLAYGIDIAAHKAAVKNNVQTIAGLAHGLDRLYPSQHTATAKEMIKNGGLITDFITGTNPDRENFPKRNRIVAGISDATIVIESAIKGGALITAEIANGYNRDVFAVPGRPDDKYSAGCNNMINRNKAALVTSGQDLLELMGWTEANELKSAPVQTTLLMDLSEEQQHLINILKEGQLMIDELCLKAEMPMSKVAAMLLELEFAGAVRNLPGKVYRLN
ncbi:MAG: DNA processing protein [Granulosicoccus sp.]